MRRLAVLTASAALAGACSAGGSPAGTTLRDATGAPTTTGASPAPAATHPAPTTGADRAGDVTSTVAPEPAPTTTPPTTTPPAATIPATDPAPVPLDETTLVLTEIASGLRSPVFVDAPVGDDRLFVVDQDGIIHVLSDDGSATFLDLTERVVFGDEQGLLGIAFHPGFDGNGRFYVHYSGAGGATVVEEYRVGADPNAADPGSGRLVFTRPQPAANHNGGMIAFGPDGYLYLALGDGGGAGDGFGNGQNRGTPLGAILRIDVDGGDPYAVPADNPFAAGGGAPEIWAMGLRNPWRFSFDGDAVWIGDVGQSRWEEIDRADRRDRGLNFGWPIMEGSHCFERPTCATDGLSLPILEYPHEGGACSIIGGYVYRGGSIPQLGGAYFYGDYCTGSISSFFVDGEGIFAQREWRGLQLPGLTSFGTDGAGELYVTAASGEVYRIDRRT